MADPLYVGGPAGAENVFLQELPSSFGASVRATAGQAWETNPATLIHQWVNREEVDQRSAGSRVVPAEEARERIARERLELTVGNEGIRESALNDLIERKYQERVRQDTISRGPDGLLAGTARFGTGLAVSVVDPLNVASAFIPVVGELRYAQLLARAGTSTLARAGVRAGVGATEGLVGAAVLEPVVYGLAQDLQKDYTMADSLMNLAFGTILGGGLHVGVGAVRDHVSAGRAVETTSAQSDIGKMVSEMSIQDRMNVGKVALAQAIEGRAVDVEALMPARRTGEVRTDEPAPIGVDAVRAPEQVAEAPVTRGADAPDMTARIQELAARSNSPEAFVRPDDAKASIEAKQMLEAEKAPQAKAGAEVKESEVQTKLMAEEERALNDTAKAMEIEINPKEFEAVDKHIADTETMNKAIRALAACQLRKG